MKADGTQAPHAPAFVARVAVRWSDLDALRHVNNASYLTYLEEARLQWMLALHAERDASAVPVLATSVLEYRQPIAWPAALDVQLACTRLGRTSITLAHRIVDAATPERLYCDGHVVMVWMDPASGRPVPLPAAIRAAAASIA